MTAGGTLHDVVGALSAASVPHMLAGSFASSLHGRARSTADIDLVVDPTQESLARFLDALGTDRFYVDAERARTAVADRDRFNVLDLARHWKVDLVVRKDRPFSLSEFARRTSVVVLGVPTFAATAEDTVLAKLEWSSIGGSQRQIDDAAEILRLRSDELDDSYLDHWAPHLGITALLQRARERAGGR